MRKIVVPVLLLLWLGPALCMGELMHVERMESCERISSWMPDACPDNPETARLVMHAVFLLWPAFPLIVLPVVLLALLPIVRLAFPRRRSNDATTLHPGR